MNVPMTEAGAKKRRRWPSPALFLFILSPVVAELLSGSTPPAEFFRPLSLLLLSALYGSGAILIREMAHRWRKGWPSVLILGAAYGVIEEGLMVKSFFDPGWVDLGVLATYGRWSGVNWIWAAGLTIHHAVFSIGIPILLVTLVYPESRQSAWVSDRTMRGLRWLLAFVVVFGHLFLTPYRPPLGLSLLSILAVAALVKIAHALPWTAPDTPLDTMPKGARSRWFFIVSFISTIVYFGILWGLPNTGIPPVITLGLLVGWASVVLQGLLHLSGRAGWSGSRLLAMASGALAFFILLAPLQESDRTRPDDMRGMTIVAVLAAALLIALGLGQRKRSRNGSSFRDPEGPRSQEETSGDTGIH